MLSATNRLVILGHTLRFPNGMGASARVANYACGLSALGVSVTILCLKPYEPPGGPILNPHARGAFCGAEFSYTCGTSILAWRRWQRWLQNIAGLLGAARYLLMKRKHIMGILYYGAGHSSLYVLWGWLWSRLANVPLVVESTEEPFIYFEDSRWNDLRKWTFWHWAARLPDGVIVISEHLKRMFQRAVRQNVPVELIPVIVDARRFSMGECSGSHQNITFCGSLEHRGEVEILLEIWAKVFREHPGYRLHLVGDASPARMKSLVEQARSLGIEDSVTFAGLVARDMIPCVLQNSAALVLPRPAGLFSTAGLPNKIGEYLASGRPVLCTAVGDLEHYLRDGENAFLVNPDQSDLFIERLKFILANPNRAAQVGRRGRQTAEQVFGLEANCRRVVGLFERLGSALQRHS